MQAWDHFLTGNNPETIEIIESSEAAQGTYEELLSHHPSDNEAHDEL
jgi:hypothetical protein